MAIKVIIMDIDGTLVNDEKVITPPPYLPP